MEISGQFWCRRTPYLVEETNMRKLILGTLFASLMSTSAYAENIGVSMALFDDNFLTVLRNGMIAKADAMDGVDLQVEDAQNDVAKQLNQINNFIASGVDAIIVNPVDTSATEAMSAAANSAGVPLVYVNRQPVNVDALPDNQAFVASNEIESGTLAAFEGCKLLRSKGKAGGARIYVMMGELSNQAAVQRTKDFHDVLGMDMCKFITIVDEQTANWSRDEAQNLMTNWLSSGEAFDAVFSNNDEMAIGAIQAMKASGISMEEVIVTGVDATQDALASMQSGDLDVTVFQNAAGQGAGALDAALKLAKGEKIDQKVYIPFELVTPANIDGYIAKN
jgi:inositol transport system substrate-binding protein